MIEPRTRLCRSFQTAPAAVAKADTAKYLRSGLTSEGFEAPDWLVPDFEDGTAPGMKAEAVENAVELVADTSFSGEIWPRVEWSYARSALRDRGRDQIDTLVRELADEIDGVVVPKLGGLEDFERVDAILSELESRYGVPEGSVDLAIILETARARTSLREIAGRGSDTRLSAIVFGPVDYTAELGGRDLGDGRPSWSGLLESLSNETSANGLIGIGGPFDELYVTRAGVGAYNADGYASQIEREAHLGLDGSWSLHPKQTIQANHVHMPTPSELEMALSRIERANAAIAEGTGAVAIDGRMIDEATLKNYRNTIRTVQSIDARHPEQSTTRYDDPLIDRARTIDVDGSDG
ncbi:L-malyl-CoA/beta-methylmalyl-CoA lyase [Halovivax gelatinilyticus]|uniref:L-malyl-CoA/beta-methylmalyl-CoA lyase n=1 Tax=Halovivax gelatinilyticus TaxID=2961597 RepID=UPI0020CA625A|nr:L-malyl-CoA/beta-methylmalyl-CoA lyase [Halovivax gelatinilyticus]